MAFSTTSTTTVPIPTSVTQETNVSAAGYVRPKSYNPSYSGGRAYISITTAATTSQAAERLCVLSVTSGTMGAITIYDNATTAAGTVVYAIATSVVGPVVLNIPLSSGITIVTAAATACIVTYE